MRGIERWDWSKGYVEGWDWWTVRSTNGKAGPTWSGGAARRVEPSEQTTRSTCLSSFAKEEDVQQPRRQQDTWKNADKEPSRCNAHVERFGGGHARHRRLAMSVYEPVLAPSERTNVAEVRRSLVLDANYIGVWTCRS